MKCGTISFGPTPQDESLGSTVLVAACGTSAATRALTGETSLRKLVVLWLLLVPVAGFAASGDEFYQRLYQRGMAHFAAGDYVHAFMELRNAAFGFVEHVDQFETAQSYAIIAAHRLGHDNDARDSLMRIVSAEKIQPHFRSVTLPADVRAEVDSVAAALLTVEECTLLGVPAAAQQAGAAAKPPVVVPTPTKRPNVAVTAPRDKDAGCAPSMAGRKLSATVGLRPPPPSHRNAVPSAAAATFATPTGALRRREPVDAPKEETPDPTPARAQAAVNTRRQALRVQRAIDNGGPRAVVYNALRTAPPPRIPRRYASPRG
jgi:hypothetical protein